MKLVADTTKSFFKFIAFTPLPLSEVTGTSSTLYLKPKPLLVVIKTSFLAGSMFTTLSSPFSFIKVIGLEYLWTFKSFNGVCFIIPFLLNETKFKLLSKLLARYEDTIFSSELILIILLTCFPRSFHFKSGSSYTGIYK